ncbi:MAG: glutamine amidotransferase-related protein [Candidatus Poseidoniaceae archaeon]
MINMRLLVVDLLAERKAFGKEGVREIASHFDNPDIFLWSPHTKQRTDYGFGTVIDQPVDCDFIVVTGSRSNVSDWQPWMDDVAELIRSAEVPIIGICFGHQIIAAAFGGKVIRAKEGSHFVSPVTYLDGKQVNAVFTHQDHVIDAGELEVIASADHCSIAACVHPTRPITTVQYHPEATSRILSEAIKSGDMTRQEAAVFDMSKPLINVSDSLLT